METDIRVTAQRYYALQLAGPAGEAARAYLTDDRKLPEDAAERFGLGWADGKLHRHLLAELGLDAEQCIAAGLLERDAAGRLRDVVDDRLVVPSMIDDRVVHLTGIAIGDDGPAYLHIAGPTRHCYNEDAYEGPHCILVDDPIDAIALRTRGYVAMAICGPDVSVVRSLLDRRGQPPFPIYICLTADEPGAARAVRLAILLGANARIVSLHRDHGPGHMYCLGAFGALERSLSRARPLIVWLIERLAPDISPIELREGLEPVLQLLVQRDAATQEAYLHIIAARFGLNTDERRAYRSTLRYATTPSPSLAQEAAPSVGPGCSDSVSSAASGGLVDIAYSLLDVARRACPQREPELLDLIAELESPPVPARADSLEAQLLHCLASLRDRVEAGRLPVKLITEAFNEGKPETMHVSSASIGKRLAALGLAKVRANGGRSSVLWNETCLRQTTPSNGGRLGDSVACRV